MISITGWLVCLVIASTAQVTHATAINDTKAGADEETKVVSRVKRCCSSVSMSCCPQQSVSCFDSCRGQCVPQCQTQVCVTGKSPPKVHIYKYSSESVTQIKRALLCASSRAKFSVVKLVQ
ncbi:hypothetical protein ANCCAN_08657 [Ancylostoma caninum]|uniref:WAP domain-containing protein n=1 Tax=Ancylostoma caninum TaxID=29170 RepID=A0A368GLU0_ANCCA|nr:hypothetical protein ANCCAN_08657 [Ancylostoma caninum]